MRRMEKDLELGKRIAWLRRNGSLEQQQAAEAIGISYHTYQPYEYGRHPSRKNLELILNYYNCSRSWLLTGEGEPFPGARQKYPEVCGPPAPPETAPESPTVPRTISAPSAETGEISIGDDVTLAIQVLSSGTPYATALHLNIRSFADAVADRGRIAHVEQMQAEMEAKSRTFEERMQSMMAAMEGKIAGLNSEIATLREENAGLKAEIEVLREENTALKAEIGILRKENAYLKEKLTKPDWPAGAAGEGAA